MNMDISYDSLPLNGMLSSCAVCGYGEKRRVGYCLVWVGIAPRGEMVCMSCLSWAKGIQYEKEKPQRGDLQRV